MQDRYSEESPDENLFLLWEQHFLYFSSHPSLAYSRRKIPACWGFGELAGSALSGSTRYIKIVSVSKSNIANADKKGQAKDANFFTGRSNLRKKTGLRN